MNDYDEYWEVELIEPRFAKVEIEDEQGGKLTFWFNLN